MSDRWPATYGPGTLTRQPNTRSREFRRTFLDADETRVLLLLPTSCRTLAAIGTELGVGRPTVKTHVENISKKLGAHHTSGRCPAR